MFLKPNTITSQTKSNCWQNFLPAILGGGGGGGKAPPFGNKEFPEWRLVYKRPECTPGSGDASPADGEGGSHPCPPRLQVPLHPSPTPTSVSSELPGKGSPPWGPQQVLRGQSCWSLPGRWSLGVCKHSPSWQQQLIIPLLPKPKPGPPRLPAQGELED